MVWDQKGEDKSRGPQSPGTSQAQCHFCFRRRAKLSLSLPLLLFFPILALVENSTIELLLREAVNLI